MQLHRESGNIRGAGAGLVLVGNGKAHFVAGFREETGYTGRILVDPELVAYHAAELKRSTLRVLNPMVAVRATRAFAGGFRQGRTKGDAGQQGGILVADRGGTLLYIHRSSSPGDNAPVAEVLAALRSRTAA